MAEKKQIIIFAENNFDKYTRYLENLCVKKLFLVCGKSIEKLNIYSYLQLLQKNSNIKIIWFSDFQPNPTYESVERGVALFREEECDAILAVGGGSAIDVAKCIKLYAKMKDDIPYLHQNIVENEIPLSVMPTTAGTGSEATRFAVIYYQGEKQSVSHESCIPSVVIFDSSVLRWLPDYHKKAAMLDALCHAIESMWSVNATNKSKTYAKHAIRAIMKYGPKYLERAEENLNYQMFMAANMAGKAINITQTTAGHAMCYKLTSLYGIAHGHSAAICVKEVWWYMLQNCEQDEVLQETQDEIADAMGCKNAVAGWECFSNFLRKMHFESLPKPSKEDMLILCTSVNPERLKNHPVKLEEGAIKKIYRNVFAIFSEKSDGYLWH